MPTADGRQFCIIYLSSVGDGLRWLLPLSDGFIQRYSLASYVSYGPGANIRLLSHDQIRRCDVLICHDPDTNPFVNAQDYRKFMASFPAETQKVFVPRPALSAFWPFNAGDQTPPPLPLYQPFWPAYRKDPTNSDPAWPGGVRGEPSRYPFGDRYILAKLQQGITPEEVISSYIELDVAAVEDLDGLLSRELRRIEQDERTADIKIGNFVASNFRTHKQFATPDQASNALMLHISNEILGLLGLPVIPAALLDQLQPLIKTEAPIHPSIGRHFAASYVSAETRYLVDRHRSLTFAEYARGYVYSLVRDHAMASGVG